MSVLSVLKKKNKIVQLEVYDILLSLSSNSFSILYVYFDDNTILTFYEQNYFQYKKGG